MEQFHFSLILLAAKLLGGSVLYLVDGVLYSTWWMGFYQLHHKEDYHRYKHTPVHAGL